MLKRRLSRKRESSKEKLESLEREDSNPEEEVKSRELHKLLDRK